MGCSRRDCSTRCADLSGSHFTIRPMVPSSTHINVAIMMETAVNLKPGSVKRLTAWHRPDLGQHLDGSGQRHNPMIAYTDASGVLSPLSLKVAELAAGQRMRTAGRRLVVWNTGSW